MASGRIKGITIEIGGDTTKLQQALSSVDKSLRTTQSNLKDINKLLKLDPKNTELLTQKQKNLQDAVKSTKERLEKLKDAQTQVGKGTNEWDALQREIIATEQDLKKAEAELKDFGSVGKQQVKAVGDKFKEIGGKIKDVGAGLTKNVTAPLVAVGAASVAAFNDLDGALDTVAKKTGATGEELSNMQDIVKNLATSIPTDFGTAGEAVGEVATRFELTGDELEKLSAKFIKFADLNNTDVSSAIDNVQAAMAAFNLDADSAADVLDMLNKAGQETGVSVDELTQNLLTNQTALQEMGLSIEDSIGLLASFEKNGINSSDVLGGLKKALQNAAKQGVPMKKALVDLQKDLQNASTDTEAMQAAMELFGNKAGPAIAKAVEEGKLSLTDFSDALEDWGGSVDDTFENTLDPIDSFKTTFNEIKILGAEVGGTLLEVLEPVLRKVAEVIRDLKEKWDNLDPGVQDAIVKAGLVVAALGPVVSIVGALTVAIGLLLSPIGLIVGAIAAVVAIGVALYKNWDKIKEAAGKLKDAVVEKWNNLKESVSDAVGKLKDKVTTQWNTLKDNVSNAVSSATTWVSDKWTSMKDKVTTMQTAMLEKQKEVWGNIKETVSEKAKSIATTVSEKFGSIKETMSNKLSLAKKTVLDIFTNIKSGIKEKIDAARDFVSNAIEKIKSFFKFEWSLPHIKLPHFSIEGEFSLSPPSIPKIHVEWYKKAYEMPYLFTSPTVLAGKGFGDGGGSGEIVYGRDQLLRDIAAAKGGDTIINIYSTPGMDVNQLADRVQERLSFMQRQKERAYA
jgi:TP901 family phage tail tape measure protein